MNNTYYGGFRTRTFAQIFNSFDTFHTEFAATPFATAIATTNQSAQVDLELVFYLLYSRYGNSHIAFSDENQFRYNIFSTIFMYGPSWATRLNAQKEIRNLSIDELTKGSEATYNTALNPDTEPTMDERDGLSYISNQNKTLYTKSKIEGYANLLALVETDVSEEFINKFRKLFTKVFAADEPLLYATYNENILIDTEDN
jgi:hypothetical protein